VWKMSIRLSGEGEFPRGTVHVEFSREGKEVPSVRGMSVGDFLGYVRGGLSGKFHWQVSRGKFNT